jgi:hypothetical protein
LLEGYGRILLYKLINVGGSHARNAWGGQTNATRHEEGAGKGQHRGDQEGDP